MSRMFGWDLPPGVRISDIPGNRPEDELEEKFWEALAEFIEKESIESIGPIEGGGSANYVKVDDIWDDVNFVKIIQAARNVGYNHGFSDGKMESDMAYGAIESDVAEVMREWLEERPAASARKYLEREAKARAYFRSKDEDDG